VGKLEAEVNVVERKLAKHRITEVNTAGRQAPPGRFRLWQLFSEPKFDLLCTIPRT
jgi:hypothetical protein